MEEARAVDERRSDQRLVEQSSVAAAQARATTDVAHQSRVEAHSQQVEVRLRAEANSVQPRVWVGLGRPERSPGQIGRLCLAGTDLETPSVRPADDGVQRWQDGVPSLQEGAQANPHVRACKICW